MLQSSLGQSSSSYISTQQVFLFSFNHTVDVGYATPVCSLLQSGHHPGTIGQIDPMVPDSILAAQEELHLHGKNKGGQYLALQQHPKCMNHRDTE